MSWQGGTQLGDRFHTGSPGDDYYQEPQNKGAVAYTKGQNLSTDPTTGNVIRAPLTAARKPFFVVHSDAAIGDPRVFCWKQDGQRLVGMSGTALKPNQRLKPSTTTQDRLDAMVEGTDSEALCWGVYKGTIDLGVDVTSGSVRADDADAGELILYDFRPY